MEHITRVFSCAVQTICHRGRIVIPAAFVTPNATPILLISFVWVDSLLGFLMHLYTGSSPQSPCRNILRSIYITGVVLCPGGLGSSLHSPSCAQPGSLKNKGLDRTSLSKSSGLSGLRAICGRMRCSCSRWFRLSVSPGQSRTANSLGNKKVIHFNSIRVLPSTGVDSNLIISRLRVQNGA